MAATPEAIDAVRQELALFRQSFESVTLKLADYDLMLQANSPWKAEVERLLSEQGKNQEDLIASLHGFCRKVNVSITEINRKLRDNPPWRGEEKEESGNVSAERHRAQRLQRKGRRLGQMERSSMS